MAADASESRRRFIREAATAAGVAAATAYVGFAPEHWPLSMRDATGERGKPRPPRYRLPGYSVDPPSSAKVMGIAHGEDHLAMLRMAVGAIGGIEHYIKPGDIVVLKPNVAFDRAPKLGATTNPDVLGALIKLVRAAGAREVRVADNPIESPESCFYRTGIKKAAEDEGARVILPTPDTFEILSVPGAALIPEWPFFYRPFAGATKVIGVAPVKDHNLCSASMNMKNWYGLLGGRRNQFHQDIHTIIADLTLMIAPTFVVLDGSRVLVRDGPTGGDLSDVQEGLTLVASTDQVAADAYGFSELLQRKTDPPRYLELARARGLGNPDWRSVSYAEEKVG